MKKSNKTLICIILAISITAMIAVGLTACSGSSGQESGQETVIIAHWANYYRSIAEIEIDSDFIGLIEISGEVRYEEIVPDGVDIEKEDAYTIPVTIYSATVIDSFRNHKESIEIFMTGRAGQAVISDDPLMKIGDVWFIFAKQNDDGTFSILGGPQGRFVYDKDNDTISSLSYIESPYSRAELEDEFDIYMVDLNLSQVRDEIAS